MRTNWLLSALCLWGTSLALAQQPTPAGRPMNDVSFSPMNQAFRDGFKDFDKTFAEGFKDFDKAFAGMDEDFKRSFSGFDKTFRDYFRAIEQEPNMNHPSSLGSLTDAERGYAVDLLQKTRADLLKSVQGLSDAQLRYKSDSTRWSVAECVEHIALAETGIFQIEQGAMNAPADPAKRAEIRVTDEQVVKILTNRSGKATSPEVIRPTGRFPTVQAALQMFGQQRDRTIDYIKTTPDDLRTHYWKHPATGTVDAYQTILLLAAHGERHRLQIDELKASKGFPEK
ncbi:MAG: DinB family protein [Bacteroidetes bacterium]|nr:DinB family protein [Fibrella sp.]